MNDIPPFFSSPEDGHGLASALQAIELLSGKDIADVKSAVNVINARNNTKRIRLLGTL